jgi:Ran GTPase-activating protein (RanGAP) involved in mRNA processing and transport
MYSYTTLAATQTALAVTDATTTFVDTQDATKTASSVAPDPPFVAALNVVPAEDWRSYWPADRTFMLRRTCTKVRQAIDMMHFPVNVCLDKEVWCPNQKLNQNKKLIIKNLLRIASLYSIKKLVLPPLYCMTTDNILELLQKSPEIEHLDINKNFIHDDGAYIIAGAIGKLRLTHLNLEKNYIGSKGMKYFAEGISNYTALQHLNIGSNSIGATGINYLTRALLNCSALTELNLSANTIKDEDLIRFVNESKFRALASVDLSNNQIEGATGLRLLLQENKSIARLNVNHNLIGTRGTICITAVLSMQKNALEELHINYNQIGINGAERFVNSMKYLDLTLIDLSHNLLNCNQIGKIAEALDKYPTLTYFV